MRNEDLVGLNLDFGAGILRTVHRWHDRPPLPQTLCSLRFQRAFCCNKEKRTFILEKCRTLFICNISTNASSLLNILLDILDWKLTLTSHTYFESPPLRKRRWLLQGIPSAWANICSDRDFPTHRSCEYSRPMLPSAKKGVSWCCGSHCWLAFVLWCGYCSVSFESFVLRHLVITPSATPRNYYH